MIKKFLKVLSKDDFREVNSSKGIEINFRCPICGDSTRKKYVKKFYYNLNNNKFHCFKNGCSGGIADLVAKFPTLIGVDYIKLNEFISNQNIYEFLNPSLGMKSKTTIVEYDRTFPDGVRLDFLLKDNQWKDLDLIDQRQLKLVVTYLAMRGVSKEYFDYFYYVFPDEPDFKNYILTLSDYNGEVVYSGRALNENVIPRYKHQKDVPWKNILGFYELVSKNKGNDVYVVEGWFDALIMNQLGYNSVCVFGLENFTYKNKLLKQLDYNLIFVPDNDSSLKKFINKNYQYKDLINIKMIPSHDFNDLYLKYKDNTKEIFNNLEVIDLNSYIIKQKLAKI